MEFFPDQIPESVYLIYPSVSGHGLFASQPPLAAAFLVKAPDPDDSNRPILFLVTARHVVDPRWAHCAKQNPGSIELRLNKRMGGVGYENLLLRSGSTSTFLTSPDPAVDLALMPLDTTVITNLSDYKLLETSSDDLLASSDLPFLHQNLPVRTAAYSASFAQGEVPYPIRHSGSILEMRDDVTEAPCSAYDIGQESQGAQDEAGHSLRHLWFINADATASLIGAPVFVDLKRVAGGGSARMLLGVQSDIFSQKGVVWITPSYLLGDLVRSALRERRLDRTSLQGTLKKGRRPTGSRIRDYE